MGRAPSPPQCANGRPLSFPHAGEGRWRGLRERGGDPPPVRARGGGCCQEPCPGPKTARLQAHSPTTGNRLSPPASPCARGSLGASVRASATDHECAAETAAVCRGRVGPARPVASVPAVRSACGRQGRAARAPPLCAPRPSTRAPAGHRAARGARVRCPHPGGCSSSVNTPLEPR